MRCVVRLLFPSLLLVGACATTSPHEETATVGETAPTSVATTQAAKQADPSTQPTSILTERLEPVRGGARVLPPYKGPEPCKMALAGQSPVAKACSEGGQRRAVELMTLFVKRARAEGIVFECTDCHASEEDLSQLKPHAELEFRKLLFLARPPD